MAQSRASHFSNALIKEKMLPIPGTMTGRKRRSQSRLGPLGPSGQRGRKLKRYWGRWRSEGANAKRPWSFRLRPDAAAAAWRFFSVRKGKFDCWKGRFYGFLQPCRLDGSICPSSAFFSVQSPLNELFLSALWRISDVWDESASQKPFSLKSLYLTQIVTC